MKKLTLIALVTLSLLRTGWTPVDAKEMNYDHATYTELKAPISLPLLPEYNGVKPLFTFGQKAELRDVGRVGFTYEYQVHETTPQVLDWYYAALKQSGWQMDSDKRIGNAVSATRDKEGYGISVTSVPAQKPTYKSTLMVGYTMFEPVADDASETDKTKKPSNAANANTSAGAGYRSTRPEYKPR